MFAVHYCVLLPEVCREAANCRY